MKSPRLKPPRVWVLWTAMSWVTWTGAAPSSQPFLLGVNTHAKETWQCARLPCPQGHLKPDVRARDLPMSTADLRTLLNASGYNSIREFIDWGWVQTTRDGPFKTIPEAEPTGPVVDLNAQYSIITDKELNKKISPLLLLGMLNRNVFDPNSAGKSIGDLKHPSTHAAYSQGLLSYVRFALQTYPNVHLLEFGNEFNAPWSMNMCPERPEGGYRDYVKSPQWASCKERISAARYIEYLAPVSRYIKQDLHRGDVVLISQGLADNPDPSSNPNESRDGIHDGPWLKSFVANGGMQYVDGLGIHVYDVADGPKVSRLIVWLNTTHEALKKDPKYLDKPWYITEVGWPTGPWGTASAPAWPPHPISEQDQANYAVQFILLARTLPFVRGVWWYDFVDNGKGFDSIESNFGQVHFSSPGAKAVTKPVLAQMTCLAPSVTDPARTGFKLVAGNIDEVHQGVYVVQFKHMPDGKRTWALWSSSSQPLLVHLGVSGSASVPAQLYRGACNSSSASSLSLGPSGQYELSVTAEPVYVALPTGVDASVALKVSVQDGWNWKWWQ